MQRIGLIVCIAVFVAVVFSVSFESMWDLWSSSDHAHGLLVFPISLFLIWRLRDQLADVPIAADARALLLILPLTAAWLGARLGGIQAIEHVAVLSLIPASVSALVGSKIAYKLLFPLLFLVLATPLGESLVPHLMIITADLSAGLLRLSGIPMLRNGQYMSLPGGEFVVADVCSGLRYLLTGVIVSLLFGYLTYSKWRKRLILVVATAVTLVLANGVRAYIVMAVASSTHMRYLGGRDHVYFGWLLFGIVMMLIMWVGARYADDEKLDRADSSDSTAVRATHTALPLIAALGLVMLAVTIRPLQAELGETTFMLAAALALFVFVILLVRRTKKISNDGTPAVKVAESKFIGRHAVTIVATLAVLVTTPLFLAAVENGATEVVQDVDLQSLQACSGSSPWQNAWLPQFNAPDVERSATLTCSGAPVSVYVAAYASALQGSELISSSHHVISPDWDRTSESSFAMIDVGDAQTHRIVEVKIDGPAIQSLVWYWYNVDGQVTSSPLTTKMAQLVALLRGRPAGGYVVVLETPTDRGLRQARERLESVAVAVLETGSRKPSNGQL